MRIFKRLKNKIDPSVKEPWTNINKTPKEVFSDACNLIAVNLSKYGFKYSASNNALTKKSQNENFTYKLDFGSSHRNKKGQSVNLNINFQVFSNDLLKFRKEIFSKHPSKNLGQPSGLVTTTNFGYLTDKESYLEGSWNLLKTDPKEIAMLLTQYALPSFQKFETIDNLIELLRSNGLIKEFQSEYMTLDFIMCYSGFEASYDALKHMLIKRNWTEDFSRLFDDLEKGKQLIDNRYFLIALVERAFLYGLKIKN